VTSTYYSFDFDFIPPEEPDPYQEGSFRAAGPPTDPRHPFHLLIYLLHLIV
jgi:hypothetical protein